MERLTRVEDGFDYAITIEDRERVRSAVDGESHVPLQRAADEEDFRVVCENNRDYRPLFGPQPAR